MKNFMDELTLIIFKIFLKIKSYKTLRATTEEQVKHAMSVKHEVYVNELQYIFPDECSSWINSNNEQCIIFIVYHKNIPIGTVSLFDPARSNRLYDGYGINENCESYEIGNLALKKEYRSTQMLVFLSMFYSLYEYSRTNAIKEWLAITSKALYWSTKKFSESISLVDICTSQGKNPIAILYHDAAKKFIPTIVCIRINVSSISPYKIARDLIKTTLKIRA